MECQLDYPFPDSDSRVGLALIVRFLPPCSEQTASSLCQLLCPNKATCKSVKHIGADKSYLGARLSLTFVIIRGSDRNSRWGMV